MRTTHRVVLGVLLAASTTAHADVVGTYDVKFEEVTSNCASPLRYHHGKLTISLKGTSLIVDIDRTPLMVGVSAKNNKISAKSKSGNTMIEGMTGVFSVAGKTTPEGQLSLMMIGEFSANGKPLCSQSWNVSGPRGDAAKPKPTSAAIYDGEGHPVVRDLVHLASIGR
jgi:hypothetical protein